MSIKKKINYTNYKGKKRNVKGIEMRNKNYEL